MKLFNKYKFLYKIKSTLIVAFIVFSLTIIVEYSNSSTLKSKNKTIMSLTSRTVSKLQSRFMSNTLASSKFKSTFATNMQSTSQTQNKSTFSTEFGTQSQANFKNMSTISMKGFSSFKNKNLLNKKNPTVSGLISNLDSKSQSDTNKTTPDNNDTNNFSNTQLINNNNDAKPNISEEQLLKNQQFLWNGWVKYFVLRNNDKPSGFKSNPEYFNQLRDYPNIDLNDSENGELTNIADKNTFYGLLMNNHFTFNSSKKEVGSVGSFYIENIIPVPDDKNFTGGLKNLGKFPEGYCFHVKTTASPKIKVDKNEQITKYVICGKSQSHMLNLLSKLKNLKIQDQQKKGISVETKSNSNNERADQKMAKDKKNDITGLNRKEKAEYNDPTDSWKVIQTWSGCSLRCGGGISTLQRRCTLPKPQECKGPGVITRPCNSQACPQYIKKLQSKAGALKPPKVVMAKFSNKPENYEKCIIKDTDVMMSFYTEKNVKYRLPVRIVMNTSTVSIYKDPNDIKSNQATLNMYNTKLSKSKTNYECFILSNSSRKIEICPFKLDTEDLTEQDLKNKIDPSSIPKSKLLFYQEWLFDFSLFQNQCTKVDRQNALKNELTDLLDKKKQEIKDQIDVERKELLAKKEHNDNQKELYRKLDQNSDLTLTALKNEAKLEDLIENEEKEKENNEVQELKDTVESLNKKQMQCRLQIKERERESQLNLQARMEKSRLDEAKEKTRSTILKQRQDLKDKIENMRKNSKRQSNELKRQILNIRTKITKQIKKGYKKGNDDKCRQGLDNAERKKAYCDANYSTEYTQHQLCLTDEFCKMCCDNEFGNVFVSEKDSCITNVCLSDRESSKTESTGDEWLYNTKKNDGTAAADNSNDSSKSN
jgi:hypothetical protein